MTEASAATFSALALSNAASAELISVSEVILLLISARSRRSSKSFSFNVASARKTEA
jgi:hypothetical protein